MPIDMKEIIVQAAARLLFEKKVKKLTVKDIVEECHITRQAFYYHFSDIPNLLQWSLEQEEDHILRTCRDFSGAEERIRYLFLVTINAKPYVQKGIQSNYGPELDRMLSEHLKDLFAQIAEEEHAYQSLDTFERKLIIRYHTQAVIGLLREWSADDTANLDRIVHEVYLIISGRLPA